MPKKDKGDEPEKHVILGRPGNNVKIGIVGLPNVGKSSFFNAVSKLNVAAENYPFCTIEPNLARVAVPDKRFDQLCEFHKPKSIVPAALAITDIAGLVKGASEGAGLGNKFLSHISACDALYQVVRAFEDVEVTHVEDTVDPVRDMEIIHEELLKKDMETVEGAIEQMEKVVLRTNNSKEKKEEHEILLKVREYLKTNKDIRSATWGAREIEVLNNYYFLSAKPMIYLVNLTEKNYCAKQGKWLLPVKEWIDKRGNGETMIPFSCVFESKLLEMPPEEADKYCHEIKARSVLPKIITYGYHALNLVHFFTAGSDEVKCWTIKQGTLAPQAAGVIHTDFEQGFICAEVYSFEVFLQYKNEPAIRAAGQLRQEGRKYEVQDGDIIFFKFNVTTQKKK